VDREAHWLWVMKSVLQPFSAYTFIFEKYVEMLSLDVSYLLSFPD
jgi:hypothetical protein